MGYTQRKASFMHHTIPLNPDYPLSFLNVSMSSVNVREFTKCDKNLVHTFIQLLQRLSQYFMRFVFLKLSSEIGKYRKRKVFWFSAMLSWLFLMMKTSVLFQQTKGG